MSSCGTLVPERIPCYVFHTHTNKLFLWNKSTADRNSVNKQNTLNTGKIRVQLRAWMHPNFYFLTMQKKHVMMSPLFWTWDLSRNRNQLFFEKILHVNKLKLSKVSLIVPNNKIVLSRTWKKIPAISKILCSFYWKIKKHLVFAFIQTS